MAQRNGFTPEGLYPKISLPWTELDIPYPIPSTLGEIDLHKVADNFAAMKMQIDDQSRYLNRTTFDAAAGTRWATIVIAASDSSLKSKSTADYVCTGSGDATIINQAIASMIVELNGGPLGRIVLLEGTYNVGATPIASTNLNGSSLHIQGMGGLGRTDTKDGTRIVGTGILFNFAGSSIGTGSNLMLSDLQIVSTSTTTVSACIVGRDIPLYMTRCMVKNGNGGSGISTTASTGSGAATRIIDNHFYIVGGDTAVTVNGGSSNDEPCFVSNNYMLIGSAGTGVIARTNSSTVPSYQITDNYIVGAGAATAGVGIKIEGNNVENCNVNGNTIVAVGTGIQAGGYRHLITGNLIQGCTIGYDALVFAPEYHAVMGNHVVACSSVAFRFGSVAAAGMKEGVIAFNRISASPLATAVVIGAGTNCGVFYNDWYGCASYLSDGGTATRTEGWFLTAAILPAHATSHQVGGSDPLTGLLDANARVGIRKNSTGSTFLRRRVNLIEGANVTITATDDSGSEEVDVVIAASITGGGGATTQVIAQVAHGLAVKDVIRYNGSAYVKAKADSATNSQVVGIVSTVTDADNFTFTMLGAVSSLSGFTAGTLYYLDPSTAGALTSTEPSTVGQISKPLLIAYSTTAGYFFNFRGIAAGGSVVASNAGSAYFTHLAFR